MICAQGAFRSISRSLTCYVQTNVSSKPPDVDFTPAQRGSVRMTLGAGEWPHTDICSENIKQMNFTRYDNGLRCSAIKLNSRISRRCVMLVLFCFRLLEKDSEL